MQGATLEAPPPTNTAAADGWVDALHEHLPAAWAAIFVLGCRDSWDIAQVLPVSESDASLLLWILDDHDGIDVVSDDRGPHTRVVVRLDARDVTIARATFDGLDEASREALVRSDTPAAVARRNQLFRLLTKGVKATRPQPMSSTTRCAAPRATRRRPVATARERRSAPARRSRSTSSSGDDPGPPGGSRRAGRRSRHPILPRSRAGRGTGADA